MARFPLSEAEITRLAQDLISGFTSYADEYPNPPVAELSRESLWINRALSTSSYSHLSASVGATAAARRAGT